MNDFKDVSDKYIRQMMDLYKRHPQAMPSDGHTGDEVTPIEDETLKVPKSEPTVEEVPEDVSQVQDTQSLPPIETTLPLDGGSPLEERFPPPERLPFLTPSENVPPLEKVSAKVESQPLDLDSVGYLQVVVSSADQAIPTFGASVIVSKTVGEGEEILYSFMTDENGETPVFELPTVDAKMSQSPDLSNDGHRPYAVYNVSTYAIDYFQVKNLNVPIFSGITSIQRVNMIPLPVHTQERKVITYSEYEPNL